MLVSIITPYYKPNKKLFNRLVETVENQSDKNFEWVIVSDGTPLPKLDKLNINIKMASLSDNYGPSVARNVGFLISDGDVICYADTDDELLLDRVQHVREAFLSEETIKLMFSAYIIEQDDSKYLYSLYDVVQELNLDVLGTLQKSNLSIPLGVSHTRDSFMIGGMFQRGIVCGEDGILWRRMTEKIDRNTIRISNDIAGIYKVNNNGQSRTQRRFDKGGFAFDGSRIDGTHGQYLDKEWFNAFSSVRRFDAKESV